MNTSFFFRSQIVIYLLLAVSCTPNEDASIHETENFLTEDQRLHIAFTGSKPVFGISDMCVDKDGRYYLVNFHQKLLATINPEGEVDGYLIRPGRGPGDIDTPMKVYCYEDRAHVLEMGTNARIQAFEPDLSNGNIINVLPGTFDFSIFENKVYISSSRNVQGKILTLHKFEDNNLFNLVSAYEDPDYPVYTFSQTNFHGTIAAWHMFDNRVKLFNSELQHLEDIELPAELYNGAYEGEERISMSDISSKSHSRIVFASATDTYFITQIREFNSKDNGKIALHLFNENKWIYRYLEEDMTFIQHNNNRLYAFKFNETPYGELTVIRYKLHLP